MKFRVLLASLFASLSAWAQSPPPRPERFARPVMVDGLPNFHQVTPGLYRSAQPSRAGFAAAEKLGIRTVISLRDDVGDDELVTGTKLKLVRVPMALGSVNETALAQVIALLQQKKHGPFLVHCQMGADRTGTVMALWRILIDGWTRADAIAEMRATGMGIEHFATYIATADLARLHPSREKAR